MNIIIDLEHTISNAWHRIERKKHNGFHINKDFQEEFVNDRPNNNVIEFMQQLADNNHTLIILSGKDYYKYIDDIRNWLLLHKVPYTQLICKDSASDESTIDFKERIIKNMISKIDFALNDVGKECEMFGKYNIPCLRIEQR